MLLITGCSIIPSDDTSYFSDNYTFPMIKYIVGKLEKNLFVIILNLLYNTGD